MSAAKGIKTIVTDSHFLVPFFVLLAGSLFWWRCTKVCACERSEEQNVEKCLASVVTKVEKEGLSLHGLGRDLRTDGGRLAGCGGGSDEAGECGVLSVCDFAVHGRRGVYGTVDVSDSAEGDQLMSLPIWRRRST